MKLVKYANIGVKLLLVGLFAHYLLFPDLPQYQNKGMPARLIIYPLLVSSVFIIHSLVQLRARKKIVYPHLADFFISLAFTFDVLGNTLNLFNTIAWWDDLMHLVLWGLWVLGVGCLLRQFSSLSRLAVGSLTLGFGAVTNILWELGEYMSFVPDNPTEGPEAYRDTMGDMALSLLASLVSAILISTVFWLVVKKTNSKSKV